MIDTPVYNPATGTPAGTQPHNVTVIDSKGNAFDNVDTSRLNPALPYAQQIPGSADYKTVLPEGFIGPPAPGEVTTPTKTVLPPGFIGPPAPSEVVAPEKSTTPEPANSAKTTLPAGFIGPPAPGEVVAPAKPTTPAASTPAKTVLPAGFIGPPAPGEVVTPAKSTTIPGGSPSTPVSQAKQDAALAELKPYQDATGNYNINQYLLDSKSPGNSLQVLRDAGFTQQQISTAAHQNLDLAQQAQKQVEQEYSTGAVAKYAANEVAELVIPGVSTAENWGHLSLWQKIVYPALDVVTLIPVVGEAAKGIEIGAKGLSVGAEIASLGGRDAVDIAAKDSAAALDSAVEKRAAQQALLDTATDKAASETNEAMKSVYQAAAKNAKQDLNLVDKELPDLTKQTANLQKLSAAAKNADIATSAGAKVYQAAEKIESLPERTQVGLKIGNIKAQTSLANVVQKGGGAAISVVGATTTIKDWNNLSPVQRVAGIAMSALPLGAFGKAKNLAEDIANPYKIPLKGIAERPASGEIRPGEIFEEGGGAAGGTTRLVIDPSAPPEQARDAMASLMRQLHETGGTAKVEYAGHEITLKGTDFQKTVGGNVSFSGTPMGEIFKEGTGAFGTKTRLESYLTKVNAALDTDKPITIEAKYKVKNPATGEMEEKTVTTNVTPGVTIKGKEGGMYYGQTLYNKFSHQAAYGATGHTDAGVILHDAGIEGLPRKLAGEKLGQMQQDAYKLFNGTRDVNQEVESFKHYKIFAEGENVVTNGSQLTRVQNLRSILADKLGQTKGEYFTRDSKGKIELFQMYLEGGRTTPYTLKELYQLKGNALKNALADIGAGLKNKLDELQGKKPTPVEESYGTKEEQISAAFAKIDKDVKEGKLDTNDALDAKRQAIEDARDTAREELRKEVLEEARNRALEAVRKGEPITETRITNTTNRTNEAAVSPATGRQAVPQAERDNAIAVSSSPARPEPTSGSRTSTPPPTREQTAVPTSEPARTVAPTRGPATPEPNRAAPIAEPSRPTLPGGQQKRTEPPTAPPPVRSVPPRTGTPTTGDTRVPPSRRPDRPYKNKLQLPRSSQNPNPQEKEETAPLVSASGILTWRQGELHGKDVFETKRQPYDKTPLETTVGNPPPGATIIKGPGSAKQTIKILSGEAPKEEVKSKIGAFDAVIQPTGKQKVTIRFVENTESNHKSRSSKSPNNQPVRKSTTRDLGGGIIETIYKGRRRRHLRL